MSNITMTVDDDLIRKVKKVAIEKNTTLTALVREHMERLAQQDDARRGDAVAWLKRSFVRFGRDFGSRRCTREQLHER